MRGRDRAVDVMGFLGDVFDFLTNSDQWHGDESIPRLLGQHVQLTVVSVLVAALVALADRHPARARAQGRRDRGQHRQHRPRAAGVRAADPRRCSGSASAIPPASSRPCSRCPRSSPCSPSRVPPMLANAYVGMASVDDEIRESARGMGMNGRQMIWRVELPTRCRWSWPACAPRPWRVVATATLAALRRLRRLRPLHRRRLRGEGQRQGLRRRPARRAARDRARARARAGPAGAHVTGHPRRGEGQGARPGDGSVAPTGAML